MLASAFQEYGFQTVPLSETLFISMLHGPVMILVGARAIYNVLGQTHQAP